MQEDTNLVKEYEEEVRELLETKTGAEKVVIFDHEVGTSYCRCPPVFVYLCIACLI